MAENPQRVAVIDVGSNSTRLLVADIDGGVSVVERQSRVTRLGRGVDLSGQLADEAIEAACAAIADYVEICREAGAERTAEIAFHASLQAGVVRHTERHISGDPPTMVELEALAGDVRALIADALAGQDGARAAAGIAVAGTPTSLSAIDLGLDPYDPARVHGHLLTLETIQRLLSQLASTPLAERVEIPGMHPDRAPTIIAGGVILIEALRAFGLDRIQASEHDIL